ncbi:MULTISPECIES: hypothetical protein [Burkholderia]|uniref:Uncharacterized protein n=1 Tax=Burkholderia cenocepacia TaxID=95486 RepID=A0ABD4UCJ9_9BURK|nr:MULTISPECIES: hypothetical protein [Burkholderia]MCW3498639.1 hypothetical protein [Burkholderia cenocepacia]MCW3506273.1 hypothetical protein [Burkholderia cenocepacia]MCW3513792.1 hypothetical protein [Burkholderia cenocepacia]MCW3528942.1 hypothetical protein [Burkholderia cenocepacia]MCW3544724.1 hypothetical protein [Burkholderia cenocepacia]
MKKNEKVFDIPFTIQMTLGGIDVQRVYIVKAVGRNKAEARRTLEDGLKDDKGVFSFHKLELFYKYSKFETVK